MVGFGVFDACIGQAAAPVLRPGGPFGQPREIGQDLRARIAELVAREKLNEEDGRAVTVTLTQIGRDDWRTASVVYYRLVKRVFTNHLTETDVIAMHRVFGKVLEG